MSKVRPETLEPGQLWENALGNVILVLKDRDQQLSVANLNPFTHEPFVMHNFSRNAVSAGWTYLGMLTDKGE